MPIKHQKNSFSFYIQNSVIAICILFFGNINYAQCAMCRAALSSQEDTAQAEAVNDGIVFLMVIPYLLVAVVGYAIYRLYSNKKKKII